jgi:hypothetical protein
MVAAQDRNLIGFFLGIAWIVYGGPSAFASRAPHIGLKSGYQGEAPYQQVASGW